MNSDTLAELKEQDLQDIHNLHAGVVEILYHEAYQDGTCAAVYEINGVRHYRAMEYTYDDELQDGVKRLPEFAYWEQCYGYDTTEKHYCMGERYRNLFGPYESEVFYTVQE